MKVIETVVTVVTNEVTWFLDFGMLESGLFNLSFFLGLLLILTPSNGAQKRHF